MIAANEAKMQMFSGGVRDDMKHETGASML